MSAALWFRIVATAEAVSWAGLLVGMLFKYVVVGTEVGVHVFGPIHGGIFVAYVASVLLLFRRFGWGPGRLLAALVVAVPPFATLLAERWVPRPAAATPAEAAAPA